MRQPTSILEQIDLIGKLADLKEQHYHNTLLLTALIELLTEKGFLTEQEIRARTSLLDTLEPLCPAPGQAAISSLTPHEANPSL